MVHRVGWRSGDSARRTLDGVAPELDVAVHGHPVRVRDAGRSWSQVNVSQSTATWSLKSRLTESVELPHVT